MKSRKPPKLHALDHVAKSYLPFKIKQVSEDTSSGDVIIEGWANPATTDRGGERVDPTKWDLVDFQKNPVLLFNHGKDPNYGMLPIGGVSQIQATEQGLYARAVISKSASEKIAVIRDLVSEGFLRTFSVGFDPGEDTQAADGTIDVAGGKLLELSVVTIPMHQDALFSLASKDYRGVKRKAAVDALKTKGALLASYLLDRIGQLQQEDASFNRDQALTAIGKAAGADLADLKNVLSGETMDVSSTLLGAFADTLSLDKSQLKKLNDEDAAMAAKKTGGAQQPGANLKAAPPPLRDDSPVTWVTDAERSPKPLVPEAPNGEAQSPLPNAELAAPPPHVAPPAAPTNPDAPPPPHEDVKPDAAPDAQTPKVQAIKVPKSGMDTQEAAQSAVSQAGWDASNPDEDDDNWIFIQDDPANFDMESMDMLDLGNGCSAQIGMPKGAPKAVEPKADDPEDEKEFTKSGKSAKKPGKSKDAGTDEIAAADAPQPSNDDIKPVAVGQDACAACLSKHMQEGLAKGQTHSDARAIAVANCKTECPTEKSDDGSQSYLPGQAEAFCDGYTTRQDHLVAGAQAAQAAKSAEPKATKQAYQEPSPSTDIPPGSTGDPAAGLDGNPILDTAKQTNVLLGSLIEAVNAMSTKLDGLVSKNIPEPEPTPEEAATIAKSLEMTQNVVTALEQKIRELKSNS